VVHVGSPHLFVQPADYLAGNLDLS